MSSDVAYSAIHDFLVAQWSTTPLNFENDPPFTPPVDGNGKLLPWVAVEVYGESYDQQSIGADLPANNRFQETGQLWLHVFVAVGTGGLLPRQYGTALCNLFKGLDLDPDIEFRDMAIGPGGPGGEDGTSWRTSVCIDWVRG